MAHDERRSVRSLILVPSLITLSVTLLRLVGELNEWAPALFSRQAGGAGALVGITWLVPIFGWYFGAKLGRDTSAPSGGRVVLHVLIALLLAAGAGLFVGLVLHKGPPAVIPTVMVAGLIGSWIVWRGWPALAKTLLLYGLAARGPVIVVMLVAMLQNWGTHYDVSPPGYPADVPTVTKWIQIGVMPQLFLWIPYTMIVGALLGGIARLVTGPKPR
jgi:hypothetical protein